MSRRKKDSHLHRYKRVVIGKNGYTVFRCTMPGCSHYIRKDLAEGRLCQCSRCAQPMILDKFAMTLVNPHCKNCTVPKEEAVRKLSEMMGSLS